MNVLVTGYKGFIGSNLFRRLEQEHTIVGIDEDIFKEHNWRRKTLECLENNKIQAIFHVGACSDTLEDRVNYIMERNYEFTKLLTDWCSTFRIPIIYSSSAASYGAGGEYPSNLYGWSKYVAEGYVISNWGIALRYFNVYGPGEEHKGKMASVAYQMYMKHKRGETVKLFPGNPVRDFIHVDDVVNANLKALQGFLTLKGQAYDVGVGEPQTFEYILETLGIPFEYLGVAEIPVGYQFFTRSSHVKWLPNWEPNYTLKEGIENYKKYLDEKYSS